MTRQTRRAQTSVETEPERSNIKRQPFRKQSWPRETLGLGLAGHHPNSTLFRAPTCAKNAVHLRAPCCLGVIKRVPREHSYISTGLIVVEVLNAIRASNASADEPPHR